MRAGEGNPYDALYDVRFQCLRLELLKDWTTISGAETNAIKLLQYIGKAKTPYWKFIRVWRAMNAVQAVRKTLDARGLAGPSKVCTKVLKGLEIEYNKYIFGRPWRAEVLKKPHLKHGDQPYTPFRPWNWTKVREDLRELLRTNRGLFDTLRRNMEGRIYDNPSPDVSRLVTNPSLGYFIRMMRDVEFDGG